MQAIKAYIQLTRPLNLLIAFLSIFIGGFVTGTIHPVAKLLMACLSGTCVTAGANAVNDYFDLEIDRMNKPLRPLPRGAIRPGKAHGFGMMLFGTGIILSVLIHTTALIIAVGSSFLLYLYSLRLKKIPVWGNVTVAFVTGLAFVYGGLAVNRIGSALIVGLFAFFFHWSREIIKDIEDIEGDRSQGVRTLPIVGGVKVALIWATVLIVVLIGLTFVPYMLNMFSIRYLIAVVLGVHLFLVYTVISMWRKPEPAHLGRLALWMKLDMFFGLLAVYLGR